MGRDVDQSARLAERMAEQLLAMIDREPPLIFDGAIVDRQWLRDTVEMTASNSLQSLAAAVQQALVDEFDCTESNAGALVGTMNPFIDALRRRLLS